MLDAVTIRRRRTVEPALRAGSSKTEPWSIEVHREVAAAAAAWDELEAVAPASPYQTRRWLTRWLDVKAAGLSIQPMIVVVRDPGNVPLAVLPFGIRRRGRLNIAGFLGGRDSNFNLGLFRPGVSWDRGGVIELLRRAAAASGTSIDVFSLRNQPIAWDGIRNPLTLLDGQPSPSFAHKVALGPEPRAFLQALLSKDTRKKLRRKSERLAEIGAVEHRWAATPAERAACLDAFLDQRTARNLALGLSTSDLTDQRRFLEHASDPDVGPAAVEVHGLHCGERIVATFFGTVHRGRFCGMAMSFDADPALARSSPGELMLVALLEAKCRQGLSIFDLGIGEARYKDTYCPDAEPLFDALVPVSGRGRILAEAERLRLRAKRRIKQSSRAWAIVQWLRRGRSVFSRSPENAGPVVR